jgi:hypothetical protein
MKKLLLKASLIGSTFAAGSAMAAADHTAAITAAGTAADTNITAAVVVVVGLAAILCGVGAVLMLLKR